jgi:hypothetical protein
MEVNGRGMKASGIKPVLALCLAILLSPTPARAATIRIHGTGGTNQAPEAKTDKKPHGMPFHGNVAAIDKAAKSITMEGKAHRVFQVTAETKINKNKQPVKLDALAIGDYIGGYAREAPDGKLELVTLNINPQSSAPKGNTSKIAGKP